MSYTSEIASPEVEIAGEAAGSFFTDARNKHSDLKAMLDGNKDNLKMEAMKRIINMIAKGKDSSDLFPAVVKNVAAKNPEVKKLVYVYLMRYAEEQQDLALLSISTFQRALKDPNQLIRASALRVLSSIRVPIIAPIMMLSIKESVRDMSPYVRKVAAHAISKLYSLDAELKDQLIEVIDHLLADKTTLVLGSAVHAFEEVCPERIDLVHKHYRKLCQLLVDVDEWGQVVVINMLTRYARSQFEDPNSNDKMEESTDKFYSSNESGAESESGGDYKEKDDPANAKDTRKPYVMDPDLRLLLRNTKPLLQSRNSAVVLAVSQLYYYLAPKSEIGIISKALIRLLRNHREVQSIILTNIATISAKRRVQYIISKNMFEPYLKSFFVRSSDPTHVKLLKLEILTNLATQTNISIILREFQTYVASQDREFAAATIDAIGRCACNIKEVTDVCLSGLVHLLANKNETVVAQSVVVIKKLLQSQPSEHHDIIVQMAKLIDTVKISAARASIIWLIGEYCERVPKVAPDVLRKMAISFAHEDEYVKLQVLNLAVKLYLTNRQQTEKIVQYVFQLARYDQNYDLRDRARFLRNLILPSKPNKFTDSAKSIFLTPKPAPTIESSFKDRDQFQLGTLSHYLNQRCMDYNDLPPFPQVAPDSTVRNQPEVTPSVTDDNIHVTPVFDSATVSPEHRPVKGKGATKTTKAEKFYSDEESEEEEEEKEESEKEEESAEGEEESEEEEEEENSDEDEEEESEAEEFVAGAERSVVAEKEKSAAAAKQNDVTITKKKKDEKPNVEKTETKMADLLLDLDFDTPATSSATVLAPMTASAPMIPTGKDVNPQQNVSGSAVPLMQTAPAQFVPVKTYTLLDKMSGRGLLVAYRFTRSPSIFSSKMCSVELKLTNETDSTIENVKFSEKKFHHGMSVQGFNQLANILPQQSQTMIFGVDFADTTQGVQVELSLLDAGAKYQLNILAPVGEQLEPIVIDAETFKNLQGKLSGMNETSGKISLKGDVSFNDKRSFCLKIYEQCNVISVQGVEDKICFAGQTLSGKCPVLITCSKSSSSSGSASDPEEIKLVVNCEKMVVGSMLFKQLKSAFSAT